MHRAYRLDTRAVHTPAAGPLAPYLRNLRTDEHPLDEDAPVRLDCTRAQSRRD
ncbi:hypothetical protein [Pseudoclavibacter sp. RFBG4]|uniref:hypothetical protein n=1 Tax=Pseudoclavibacter sp. RFBG4 TaxID=2080575 RepID=UPI0015E41291|nr:hypothetical protein [Pseudoclavibacter sp. RFBG4]